MPRKMSRIERLFRAGIPVDEALARAVKALPAVRAPGRRSKPANRAKAGPVRSGLGRRGIAR